MIKIGRTTFSHETNSGFMSNRDLMVALVCWWVDQGGLAGLDQAADRCDFSHLDIKSDHWIGKIVMEDTDYFTKFLKDVSVSPVTYFLTKVSKITNFGPIDPYSDDELHPWKSPRRQAYDVILVAIGQMLCEPGGWWDRNAKRIKKERMHVKEIRKVIQS